MQVAPVVCTKKNARLIKIDRHAEGAEYVKWQWVVPKNQPGQENVRRINTVMDRDVAAGRAILYKGKNEWFELFFMNKLNLLFVCRNVCGDERTNHRIASPTCVTRRSIQSMCFSA